MNCSLCNEDLGQDSPINMEEYRRQFPDHADDPPVPVCSLCYEIFTHGVPGEDLARFVRESNYIEGIHRDPTVREILAHARFLRLETVTVWDLEQLVSVLEPGAELRRRVGCNVRVGDFHPLAGGPRVEQKLTHLLSATELSPTDRHWEYETLHPFTDGNGRSGRALWAHHRGGVPKRGFLHQWYYDSLSGLRPQWETDRRR